MGLRERAADAGTRVGETAGSARRAAGRGMKDVAKRTRRARRALGYRIAGDRPPRARRLKVAAAGAAGAAAAFFLDPVSGRRRRVVVRDRAASLLRRGGRRVKGIGQRAADGARGLRHEAVVDESAPENDAMLAHRVEGEATGRLDVPTNRTR